MHGPDVFKETEHETEPATARLAAMELI